MEDKVTEASFSFGLNPQTAETIFGAIAILVSFRFPMPFRLVSLFVSAVVCGIGVWNLLRVPFDLISVAPIRESARLLHEFVEQGVRAEEQLNKLKGCAERDVRDIVFDDWEGLAPSQKSAMKYLRDGVNDKRDWTQVYRSKHREAVKQALFQCAKIALFYNLSRLVLGVSYDRRMVDDSQEPEAEEPKPVKKKKDRTQEAIADKFLEFGIELYPDGKPEKGPSITRYAFRVSAGVKLSKLESMADDIALYLGANSVRIAQIPDRPSVIGVEVPNTTRKTVKFSDVLKSEGWRAEEASLPLALGMDIAGQAIVGDLSAFPHVLIAGTTGSGKSVCENALICSLLQLSPARVQLIMVDPKMVELAPYNGIPHLQRPVVTDPKEAVNALKWAVDEMMNRYKIFFENQAKELTKYNSLMEAQRLEPLPSIVIVIDELADLMMTAAKEAEDSIVRIAQMGRAAGVHLVIATQRPSADVITGLMKANIPNRIAFAVSSAMESRIILDAPGAEKLTGQGDMMYMPLGKKPTRVQGCYISQEEIERVVRKWTRESSRNTAKRQGAEG